MQGRILFQCSISKKFPNPQLEGYLATFGTQYHNCIRWLMDMGASGLLSLSSQFTQKGTSVAPPICTDAQMREVGSDRRNVAWSPENILVDTVARMQQNWADIRAESRQLRTPGFHLWCTLLGRWLFTTTKVPRY